MVEIEGILSETDLILEITIVTQYFGKFLPEN